MVTRREVALAGAMDRRDELLKNQFPVGDKRHGARHQGFGRDGPPRHVGGESRWPHTVGGGSHPPCKWLTSARVRYSCGGDLPVRVWESTTGREISSLVGPFVDLQSDWLIQFSP